MGSLALSFQNVPPAPGREQGTTAAPAAPAGTPGGAPPPDPGLGGLLPMLLMIVPLLLIMMWGSRSQQKKQAAMIDSLAKDDQIVTQGGLVGKFIELKDGVAKVEIAPGVKIQVLKSGILGKHSAETVAVAEKAAAEKK